MDFRADDLLTTAQLASRYQVSTETIRDWVKAGVIPEIRVGHKIRRYDYAAVIAALASRKVVAPAVS